MSQHPSLKVGGAAEAKRTVLTRFERVELLRKRGELKEGDRITGLKKTKPEEYSPPVPSLAGACLHRAFFPGGDGSPPKIPLRGRSGFAP